MAKLENQSGYYVLPSDANSRIALEEARFDEVLGATIPDPKARTAYPIVTFTWVICRKHYANPLVGEHLKDVFNSCLSDEQGKGQTLSKDLGYVALPAEALAKARKAIQLIQAD
jgi:phosphate transport system substrate-binding protein